MEDPTSALKGIKSRWRECSTGDCDDGRPCEGKWNETINCEPTECGTYVEWLHFSPV